MVLGQDLWNVGFSQVHKFKPVCVCVHSSVQQDSRVMAPSGNMPEWLNAHLHTHTQIQAYTQNPPGSLSSKASWEKWLSSCCSLEAFTEKNCTLNHRQTYSYLLSNVFLHTLTPLQLRTTVWKSRYNTEHHSLLSIHSTVWVGPCYLDKYWTDILPRSPSKINSAFFIRDTGIIRCNPTALP